MSSKIRSKREYEEEKKKAEEEAAAKAYEDFYNTFVDVPDTKSGKVWVKAGTFDAGSRKEDTKEKGKLYKPKSKYEDIRDKSLEKNNSNFDTPSRQYDRPERPGKKKEKDKKKSNLELFKEELKLIQEERAERHRVKSMLRDGGSSNRQPRMVEAPKPIETQAPVLPENITVEDVKGSYDSGDPNTTNMYLGNLNPKTTEPKLMELFGRFGPLASIKIMWPRTDDERSRGRNCGFVAFMNRKDGERCLNNLSGRDVDGFEMKMGWGKPVPIPPHPIYIPPALVELTMPPPPSGLPFNAQPDRRDISQIPNVVGTSAPLEPERITIMDKILQRAVVKVVIPTERNLLHLIHRMIEFVIREGPMFEAMIMNREIDNPDFRFLFENQSPAHVYYRWKLFSILQGECQSRWEVKPFRMFKGGSIWKPPPLNPFLQGMPEELVIRNIELEEKSKKGSMSDGQHQRLTNLIRNLTPEREKVGEAMVWCIDHAESAEEICECIAESLSNSNTNISKKIARLYLISDILHNCCVKVSNASFFRKYLQEKLLDIFKELNKTYEAIESRIRAEQVKKRVMNCFRAWEDWAIYPHDFLIKLQNTFLGFDSKAVIEKVKEEEEEEVSPVKEETADVDGIPMDDVDGFPLAPEVNGTPKEGTLVKKSAAISALLGYQDDDDEDVDGASMEEDFDGIPIGSPQRKSVAPGFVQSKWESVSPQKVESQAMTLSKWDELEANKSPALSANSNASTPVYQGKNDSRFPEPEDEEDIDGVPMEYDETEPVEMEEEVEEDEEERKSSDNESRQPVYDFIEDSRGSETINYIDNEERRAKLRQIEVKVMQYEDELEKGIRSIKSGYTLQRQVQHYRNKLLRKIEREDDRKRRHRSSSSNDERKPRKRSRHDRSRSRSPRRRRSRSPRKRHSYSRSPSRKHKKKSRR